ncbi:Golgi CORVET complex core vacuolar protein 8-domain-containing protein [Neurospora tetraspora]|uniref:Golgi CORVET complex core vacuolar protein 8-domain-containing protein n=1 Tax=Neurospora tetraspora TaxID=94610 RepID=A0AAE0MVC6_9PEZI|nr:Golgi CORVET complex core vacuolar protein 8-domain-containing protein [Neurospora tetraspora]
MSVNIPRRDEEGSVDDMMADEPDLGPTDDPSLSGDETIREHTVTAQDGEEVEEQPAAASPIAPTPIAPSAIANRYRELVEAEHDATTSEDGSTDGVLRSAASPLESFPTLSGDSPSVQGSVVSSPGSSNILPSLALRPGLRGPTPSFRPFDRRFSSFGSPGTLSPRPSSPAFLAGHSRTLSVTSNLLLDSSETETSSPPWEVVRWTKLLKLDGLAFSESGRRNFGSPTCLAVSTSIVLGTSKGVILVFDFNQNLKMIIGPGTKAVESGAVTSLAISADHTTIAGGHANGNIFTWDTTRPSRPFLSIPHLPQLQQRSTDGHVPDTKITHLGFLGTRHTALVSADDRGMAFSHLATRGTGSFGRTVKTTRILGRYPDAPPPVGKILKPSTVLAFQSLPLGNVDMATDTMGLTAMLTPYLLVIVSTTPVAQTQHKSARPKEVTAHSAMTGCLAWFPAVRLKVPDPLTGSNVSKVKLVYCWSNVLTVLEVEEEPAENKDKPPTLRFRPRNRWKCEEPIVAVQWLSRSVLTVLTITQRLIVLEDRTMRMTEAFDLIHKHIYHVDLFSKQLHTLVEQLDDEDPTMHGVVADAFYMSFKAYKGRLFLLGFTDVSLGALSNWADRLFALMESGDYVGAIRLATSYYTGDANKLTIGLPEDTALRHSMVIDKLMEIMSASLKYAFGQRTKRREAGDDKHLRELAENCFIASQNAGKTDFLFDEMYEWYEEAGLEGIFLETLEPYIIDGSITAIPPAVVKALVTHFVSNGLETRLEDIICHMDTSTLDLDQVTTLCKTHSLYDALIYVWNQALNDYLAPFIDLLALLVPLMQNGDVDGTASVLENEIRETNALKIFPYLSFILTGKTYPTGEKIPDAIAQKAKAELYWFLFSGQSIFWPKGSSKRLLTRPGQSQEPSFPYLRMILNFDAPSFLSVLNEAFEDSFLNDSPEKQLGGGPSRDLPEEEIFGLTVDRQYITSILMEIMNPADFAKEDTIYLDMFVARNLPKYPQYLLFTGSTLTKVLIGLCQYPGDDLAEDAQLSAEYLLSIYHPPDLPDLIPRFKEAGFYRILKRIYKADKQYGKLTLTYFEDPNERDAIFDCIELCLRPHSGLTRRQVQDVHQVIRDHAGKLVQIDSARAAQAIETYAPELHSHILDSVSEQPDLQYTYLKTILEPNKEMVNVRPPQQDLVEQYLQLMCRFEPSHVPEYVNKVQATNLRLEKLLPTMEETGVIDAAVMLMAKEGQVKEAMDRLTRHLETLESALHGLLTGTASQSQVDLNPQESAEELMQALQNYTRVGIWLCQEQTKATQESGNARQRHKSQPKDDLSPDEQLWLSLIESCVQITKRVTSALQPTPPPEDSTQGQLTNGGSHSNGESVLVSLDTEKLVTLVRSLVQNTFTTLLSSTSTRSSRSANTGDTPPAINANLSFLRILRAFLTRAAASSPNLADLRSVLSSIFAAYAYEESILGLSNRLLERSLFVSVNQAVQLRQRGWRPKGSTCEACGRRVWGPGVAGNVYEAWEERQAAEESQRQARKQQLTMGGGSKTSSGATAERGKGKDHDVWPATDGPQGGEEYNGSGNGNGKGKGKGEDVSSPRLKQQGESAKDQTQQANTSGHEGLQGPVMGKREQKLSPLVVLACRHVYHQACLDALEMKNGGAASNGDGLGVKRQYRCPIDR